MDKEPAPRIPPRMMEALNTVLGVSSAVNQSSTRRDIFNSTCAAAVQLLGVSHSGLAEFVPDQGKAIVRAEHPLEVGTLGQLIAVEGVPAEEALFKQETDILNYPDLDAPECKEALGAVQPMLRNYGIRAILVVPIVGQSGVIGSLSLDQMDQPRVFAQYEVDMCKLLASIVAGALEKAKLLETAEAVAGELARASQEWQDVPLRQMALAAKLDAIAALARADSGCDAAVLFSFDPRSRRLFRPSGMEGVWDKDEARARKVADPRSFVYALIRRDEPAWETDIPAHPLYGQRRFARAEHVLSLAAFPLQAGGQKVGILFLNYRTRQGLAADQQRKLEQVALRTAAAVYTAQLVEDLRQLKHRTETLARVSRELLECRKLGDVYAQALDAVTAELDVGYANVILLQPDGNLRLEKARGWEDVFHDGYVFHADEAMHARLTISRKAPAPIFDFEDREEWRYPIPEAIRNQGILSGLGVPIMQGEDVRGAMLIHSRERRCYDEPDIRFVEVLAYGTAIAMQRFQAAPEEPDQVAWPREKFATLLYQLGSPCYCLSSVLESALGGKFGDLNQQQAHQLRLCRYLISDSLRVLDDLASLEGIPFGFEAPGPSSPSVEALLDHLGSLLGEWACKLGVRLEFDAGNASRSLPAAPPEAVFRLLFNLIHTALQASAQDGSVLVRAAREGDALRFEMHLGPGLLESLVDRIREALARDSPAAAWPAQGRLGYGPIFCVKLADRIGASLAVQRLEGGGERVALQLKARLGALP